MNPFGTQGQPAGQGTTCRQLGNRADKQPVCTAYCCSCLHALTTAGQAMRSPRQLTILFSLFFPSIKDVISHFHAEACDIHNYCHGNLTSDTQSIRMALTVLTNVHP